MSLDLLPRVSGPEVSGVAIGVDEILNVENIRSCPETGAVRNLMVGLLVSRKWIFVRPAPFDLRLVRLFQPIEVTQMELCIVHFVDHGQHCSWLPLLTAKLPLKSMLAQSRPATDGTAREWQGYLPLVSWTGSQIDLQMRIGFRASFQLGVSAEANQGGAAGVAAERTNINTLLSSGAVDQASNHALGQGSDGPPTSGSSSSWEATQAFRGGGGGAPPRHKGGRAWASAQTSGKGGGKPGPVVHRYDPKKVFVAGLPTEELSRKYVWEHFRRFGVVQQVNLPVNFITGKWRGFGFVTFAREAAAEAACNQGTHMFMGALISVKYANTNGSR